MTRRKDHTLLFEREGFEEQLVRVKSHWSGSAIGWSFVGALLWWGPFEWLVDLPLGSLKELSMTDVRVRLASTDESVPAKRAGSKSRKSVGKDPASNTCNLVTSRSHAHVEQMVRAVWAKQTSSPIATCMQERSSAMAYELETACSGPVASGVETPGDAWRRVNRETARLCRQRRSSAAGSSRR